MELIGHLDERSEPGPGRLRLPRRGHTHQALDRQSLLAGVADECGYRVERAANLFDLRRIIGGVFTAWGVLLISLGLFDSQEEIDKAAGLNINLYAGIGMLVVGLLFLLWAFTRPLGEELRESEPDERAGSSTHAAPRGVDAAALASQESRRRARGHREGGGGPDDPGGQ